MPDPDPGPANTPAVPAREPLGPKGPPETSPFNEYLSFDILQVSRDDLARWLAEVETDATAQVLRIRWKDGSGHEFLAPDAPNASRPLDIAQVEEVESIYYSANYGDGSQAGFDLRRGNVTLRSNARIQNSRAQYRVFAVRNQIETSEAIRAPSARVREIGPRLIIAAMTALLFVPLLRVLILPPSSREFTLDAGLFVGGLLVAGAISWNLSRFRPFRDPRSITDPLVVAYPPRNERPSRLTIFSVIVGVFGILGAIAAVIVVFHAPK